MIMIFLINTLIKVVR